MIYIEKGKEPASLTKYRQEKFAYFDGCNKNDIREALLQEQGYLCAYCMRRIYNDSMKIEHWKPESELSSKEALDFSNMLGVCLGHNEGDKGKLYDTCDSHKGDIKIKMNPLNKEHIKAIKYIIKSGEIDSDDPAIKKDVNETLNLNSKTHMLQENRKAVLDEVIIKLSKLQKHGEWKKSIIEKIKHEYERVGSDGMKKEYAGIVIWYLNRKLSQ